MSSAFPHLSGKARAALAKPKPDRIKFITGGLWIPYDEAIKVLKTMEELLALPRMERMPSMLIAGASFNGKSTLLNEFELRHRPKKSDVGHTIPVPVLLISAPGIAEEEELFLNIIRAFGVPYNPAATRKVLMSQAYGLLKTYGVKVLLIDEFNQIGTGTTIKQRQVLHRLRLISKDLKLSIVAAGTREALNLLNLDPQLQTRFEPHPLPRWVLNERSLNLLATIENRLPLPESSDLDEEAFAMKLLEESEGIIGHILHLTTTLACYAISNDKSKIIPNMIEKVGWIRPSQRIMKANAVI